MKNVHSPLRARVSRLAAATASLSAALILAGCGGGGTEPTPSPNPTPAPGPSISDRTTAAQQTVASNALCSSSKLGNYYWEVGDGQGAKASGSVGTGVGATTTMSIASSSKWIYGAYVVQRRGSVSALSADDVAALNFTSGYTNFSTCQQNDTIDSCLATDSNSVKTDRHVGKFTYDGGHMQNHASASMGLGPNENVRLGIAVRSALGDEIPLAYIQPQPAGGVLMSASNYAVFLRKIVAGNLAMKDALGANQVCTNPLTCATATRTPVPTTEDWNYSMGHWVEVDAKVGDGAFSSAGAFGFYPWIDATKTWYGVLSRTGLPGAEHGGYASAQCGRLIRKAWVTGQAQLN